MSFTPWQDGELESGKRKLISLLKRKGKDAKSKGLAFFFGYF
jgi:hypothetical protein